MCNLLLTPRTLVAIVGLLTLAISVSCGSAAAPGTSQATAGPAETATSASGGGESITAATPTPVPPTGGPPGSARDSMTLVIPEEPSVMDVFSSSSAEEAGLLRYTMNDALIWYDRDTLQLVPTTASVSWDQEAPDRWRISLRPGVKFHNDEPWDAEAAAYSLNIIGQPESAATSYNYTGMINAAAVDQLTLEITCAVACPILDRSLAWTAFQAPKWHSTSTPEEISAKTISIGPYQQAEYTRGESVRVEAYANYVPAPGVEEMQKASVKEQVYLWRKEDLVRAAMVKAGEADWARDIGAENMNLVPVAKVGGTLETISWYMDNLWDPMLKQKKFREAIVHAINCQEIVDSLYKGLTTCRGIPATVGVVGATPENTAPYEYNPELSRQLLKDVNYQGEEIRISGREARVPKQTELYEAVAGYLKEVGINVKIQVMERSLWTNLRNCDPKAGYPTTKPDCDFGQIVETAPSFENMDFGKMVTREMDCNSSYGRVCDQDQIQPLIAPAMAATGEERQRRMQELADIMKNDVQRLTLMDTFVIYGMGQDLVWEPRPDQAVRGSTMSFAR